MPTKKIATGPKRPQTDMQSLMEHLLTAHVLLLARQLRADDRAQGKEGRVDDEEKAIRIIKSAREAVIFRWNYELPRQE